MTGWDWLIAGIWAIFAVMAVKEVRALRGKGETLTHHIRNHEHKWVFVGSLAAGLMFWIWGVLHFASVIP